MDEAHGPGAVPTALVSGAAGGFGRRIAAALVDRGWRVYGGLRLVDQAAGHPLHGHPGWQPIVLDMTAGDQIDAAVSTLEAREGRLDALVHCAGMDLAGSFEDLDLHAWRSVMEVNFFGTVALTRAALPLMRRQRRGVLLVMSSLSGLVGLPGNSAYAASKFALEGAFESLRHEIAPFGIGVALVEPGAYDTGMAARYHEAEGVPADSPYASLVQRCLRARSDAAGAADPGEVVDLMLKIIDEGAPRLRYPAGAQAERVVARLAGTDDESRAQFIAEVSMG